MKRATWITVSVVAVCAAVISYGHIYHLSSSHGQPAVSSVLLPLCVDGMILMASLVSLRGKVTLARVALWLGIAATVAANVADGLPGGPVASMVSAWPAIAFILTIETLIHGRAVTENVAEAVPEPVAPREYTKPKTSSELPSLRSVMTQFKVGQPRAREILQLMQEHGVSATKASSMAAKKKVTANAAQGNILNGHEA